MSEIITVARNLYYSKSTGVYNDWHRNIMNNSFKTLDIDICEYKVCLHCKTNNILFLAETCKYKGSLYKSTDLTRLLAQRANLPAYLIFWDYVYPRIDLDLNDFLKIGYDPRLVFKIAKIEHLRANKGYVFKDYTSKEWIDEMIRLREERKCDHCGKK